MQACGEWVIITQQLNERKEGGIVIPDGLKGRNTPTCTVISVGELVPDSIRPGDTVWVKGGHHGGFEVDGVAHLAVEYEKIIAIAESAE